MKKKIINELNFENIEFKNNEVIHCNGTIYESYSFFKSNYSPDKFITTNFKNKSTKINVSKILGPNPTRIQANGNLKFKGYFIYNTSELLKLVLDFGKQLYYISSNDTLKKYLEIKDTELTYALTQKNLNIESSKVKIITNFFKIFGFPFNTDSKTFPIYRIENFLIPNILIIFFINEIYETIKFFESIDTYNYTSDTLISKLQEMNKIIYLLEKEVIDFDIATFEEDFIENISYQMIDYKNTLIHIVNHYTNHFKPINLYSYLSFDLEVNSSIPVSNNLFDLVWYILINKIQINFEKGKKKKCSRCGKNIVVINNQVRCEKCQKEYNNQLTTKKNKKEFILKILDLCNNYYFDNNEINTKLLEFQELKNSKRINNIDNHKHKIKDLKSLIKQIQTEIKLKHYKKITDT